MTEAKSYRLGVDVGGTFTDLVLVAPDGRALTRKVLSTTANYAEAIITGTTALLADAGLSPSVVGDVTEPPWPPMPFWSGAARARG